MQKRAIRWIGILLLCGLFLGACGKEADAGRKAGTQGAFADGDDEGAFAGGRAEKWDMPEAEAGDDGEDVSDPEVSCKVLSELRTDDGGRELVRAQYPVFSVSGEDYKALEAALVSWNEEWKGQAEAFLDDGEELAVWYRESMDPSYLFRQDIVINIMRCDRDIVSILVTRSVEEGGPHPNNYSDARNFDARTGAMLMLSDVVEVDDALRDKIREGLCGAYPELEFDEKLLEEDIREALANQAVEWYFIDGWICINFMEGSFGFGHGEGSLGVLILPGSKG